MVGFKETERTDIGLPALARFVAAVPPILTSRRGLLSLMAAGAVGMGSIVVWRKGLPRLSPPAMPAGPFALAPVDGLRGSSGRPVPGITSADIEAGVTVVNVWASWCPYCRSEHDVLMEFARSSDRPRFLGIVYEDTAEQARTYLSTAGLPYDAVGLDEKRRFAKALGVISVPTTLVLDARGAVVKSLQGPMTRERIRDELKPAVSAALAAAATTQRQSSL